MLVLNLNKSEHERQRLDWEICQTIEMIRANSIGSDSFDVPESFERLISNAQHKRKRMVEVVPPNMKEGAEKQIKTIDAGVSTFYCKPCGKFVKFYKTAHPNEDWLSCSCRCQCDCHFEKRWNKSECVCKPCGVCGTGGIMPPNGPVANCGRQRLCHFGERCYKKDDGCGFKH